jgi:hypothetical protein
LFGAILLWFLPLAGIGGLMTGCLLLVAAHENHAGTYLPLVVLFLVVLMVLFLLILAMAYIHATVSGSR